MKTTKGGKVMNPTDAYRKELRKKELKRNKKERKKVREVGILKKDPESIREQIDKLEMMKADGALDKARKHKKRQLEDTLNLVMKKRKESLKKVSSEATFDKKEYEEKMRDKGEAPVMFSHLGPPRRRTNAEEEERAKHPKPEDSVYYHPLLNPTGAPPPGKPPMYHSSIGPRIPLPASGDTASSSISEMEEASLAVPPPPPPPPLPKSEPNSNDNSTVPSSIPLPIPPPPPPKPTASSSALVPPPPPPGPPPKERLAVHSSLPVPPPPPPQLPLQPLPPGTGEREAEKNKSTAMEGLNLKEFNRGTTMLPPPPPPPGLLVPKSEYSEAASSESHASSGSGMKDTKIMLPPPPPPPRLPPPIPPRNPLIPTSQPNMLPPGIVFPPPPPDLRPPLPVSGLPNQLPPPPPPGMIPALILRPPFAGPPGPPTAPRPMLSGQLPAYEDDPAAYKPLAPQKPSYVKSAASTVVKRPLAQHTPELTAMVPASVRVRRETAIQKTKPRPNLPVTTIASRPALMSVTIGRSETTSALSAPKTQSIDDSYTAFLEDMKALGALDS